MYKNIFLSNISKNLKSTGIFHRKFWESAIYSSVYQKGLEWSIQWQNNFAKRFNFKLLRRSIGLLPFNGLKIYCRNGTN
jgi:hypothetical protein